MNLRARFNAKLHRSSGQNNALEFNLNDIYFNWGPLSEMRITSVLF
jgi:hypothetical protein